MTAIVAEQVMDVVSFDWGGQILYFGKKIENTSSSCSDEFIIFIEDLVRKEFQSATALPCCESCNHPNNDWGPLTSDVMAAFYSFFVKGEQLYIPLDINRRNKLIRKEFTGNNINHLIRKYRVSVTGIYRILRQRKPKANNDAA